MVITGLRFVLPTETVVESERERKNYEVVA